MDPRSEGASPAEEATKADTEEPWTLRKAIRSALDYGQHVVETGRAHSPIAPHRLAAVDEAVSDAIHVGYQGVRKIAVEGHPAIILSTTGLLAALPSVPFGFRSTFRNGTLAVLLAAVMIYPDHLSRYITDNKREEKA